MIKIVGQITIYIVFIFISGCASVYPERLTYDEGVSRLKQAELCCKSVSEIKFESIPENKIIGWVVGLDEKDTAIEINESKSFFKGISLKDGAAANLIIETHPTDHSISGTNLYMFLPTAIFYDSDFNEVSKIGWDTFRYNGWGVGKKFESTAKIPEEASYLFVYSEEKNRSGYTSMLQTTNNLAIGYQEYGGIKNAAIGTLVFKFK